MLREALIIIDNMMSEARRKHTYSFVVPSLVVMQFLQLEAMEKSLVLCRAHDEHVDSFLDVPATD